MPMQKFQRTAFILDHLPEMQEAMETSGPLTLLIIPDSGWIFPNGRQIPDCVFKALALPENRHLLDDLIR